MLPGAGRFRRYRSFTLAAAAPLYLSARAGTNVVVAALQNSLVAAALAAELDRLATCTPAARALDVEEMKRLLEDWPSFD
jgi:hypothetical protein